MSSASSERRNGATEAAPELAAHFENAIITEIQTIRHDVDTSTYNPHGILSASYVYEPSRPFVGRERLMAVAAALRQLSTDPHFNHQATGYKTPTDYAASLIRSLHGEQGELYLPNVRIVNIQYGPNIAQLEAEANPRDHGMGGILIEEPVDHTVNAVPRHYLLLDYEHGPNNGYNFRLFDINERQYHTLNTLGGWVDLITGSTLPPSGSRMALGNTPVHTVFRAVGFPEQHETLERPAQTEPDDARPNTVQISERMRVPGYIAERYKRLPEDEQALSSFGMAFGDYHRDMKIPERIAFVDLNWDEADGLFVPGSFFYGSPATHPYFHPNGNPNAQIVPFAYALGSETMQQLPMGIRFKDGEEKIMPGQSNSLTGLISMLHGYDRANGQIPTAYMLAYIDALFQVYEKVPGAWERMLSAQNEAFIGLDGVHRTSASRYMRDDQARPVQSWLLMGMPGDAIADDATIRDPVALAERLQERAHNYRELIRTGTDLPEKTMEGVLALAEMAANCTNMLGLVRLIRVHLNV